MDEGIVDEIEMNIAEEIIRKYTKVISYAKRKREDYLKKKVLKSSKKIKENAYFFNEKGHTEKEVKDYLHENLMKNKIIDKLLDGYKPI